jgi:hypothetical protein
MPDRFQLVMLKFAHAKRHAEALRAIVRSFVEREPYQLGFRVETDQRPAYFVQAVKDIPPEIRCSLDHLAYQLALSHSGSPLAHPDRVYFPIAESQEKYEKRKLSCDPFFTTLKAEAVAAVDRLKPYRDGNDGLWWLHALNNIDKHRMVVTAGGSGASVDLGLGHNMLKSLETNTTFPEHVRKGMIEATQKLAEQPLFFRLAEQLFPLRSGDVFLYGAKGDTFNPTVKLKVYIAVGEPSILGPTPIDQLLDAVGNAVSSALNELKPHLE